MLPPLHRAQREIADLAVRFAVVAAGRRVGKSRLGSALCIATAAMRRRAWWVAPTYPMASIGWRMLRRLAVQIPYARIKEQDRMILFPGDGFVQVRSADNPDSLRGEGLDLTVIDECAFVVERAWTEALRPALSDRRGRALFISTPKGRNWFHRLYEYAATAGDPEWGAWRFSSYDNPFLDPAEIETAKKTLPERVFRQEYLAEFLEDGAGVFRNVLACVEQDRTISVPQAGRVYVAGIDFGRSEDYTVLCVFDVESGRCVFVDRFNTLEWTTQLVRIKAAAQTWRLQALIAERNSIGDPIISELRKSGVPVVPFLTTNATKQVLVDQLALAFEQKALTIPNEEFLINELLAFEGRTLPSGMTRYAAPEGMHDDGVIGLALGWHACLRQIGRKARQYEG